MQVPMNVLANNLLSLFFLMMIGFAISKLKLLPLSATGYLTTILMKIALPAMLITVMLRPFNKDFLVDMGIIFLTGVCLVLVLTAGTVLLARLFHIKKNHTYIWSVCTTFPNNGFMGFPIVLAVLGAEGLALAVIYNIVQNIFIYSMGAALCRRDVPDTNEKNKFSFKKTFFNAINISLFIGLILYVLQITPPDLILSPLTHLSNMTTPLSMILIGMNIGAGSFKDTVKDRDAIIGTAVKLLVVPVVLWLLLKPINFSNDLIPSVLLLTFAMPSASVAGVLAEENHSDSLLASRIIFFSTSLCFLTIPLICLLP